jgi:heptosyltransferase-3
LLIRLRSIGDAVLTTPSITALRRFLPAAQIDILLEDRVAPVLVGHSAIDNIIAYPSDNFLAQMKILRGLRAQRYDVVYNLHGGTTSTFLTALTGARHKVGFGHYRYGYLYNHLSIPALDFWRSADLQSTEQQLAMLGWTGVPVSDRPWPSLPIDEAAKKSVNDKLAAQGIGEDRPLVLLHPAAAFTSKQWPAEKFAQAADHFSSQGFSVVAVAAQNEETILRQLRESSVSGVHTFADLTLPEITALAARTHLFIGNDSGIAHIAAAVKTPSVVIFGPSNITHWRPFTDAPNAVVDSPAGIEKVDVAEVLEAAEKVLNQ